MVRNEKGAAMAVALMVMLVLTLFGTALWQYSMADTIQVARSEDKLQAHYLARSGALTGLAVITDFLRKENSYSSAFDITLNPIDGNLENVGTFSVTYLVMNPKSIKITSTGTRNNVIDAVTLTVTLGNIPEFLPIDQNPAEWVNANQLVFHKAETYSQTAEGQKYLEFMVPLMSTHQIHPLRAVSNQIHILNGGMIYFHSHASGVSLRVTAGNTTHVTLNAIYIHFEHIVEMERQNASSFGRIKIEATDPANPGELRGHTYNDYKNMIDTNPTLNSTVKTQLNNELNSKNLAAAPTKYAIIYFGGNVIFNNNPIANNTGTLSGFYFFPSTGVLLHDSTAANLNKLIPISENLAKVLRPAYGTTPWVSTSVWNKN